MISASRRFVIGWLAGACLPAAAGAPRPVEARRPPELPAVPGRRTGDWLGGPEPAGAKRVSGVTTWYRLEPERPEPGAPFVVVLRFEGVVAGDATVEIRGIDGARLLPPGAAAAWSLPRDAASEVRVRVAAPPGDSYLNVYSTQAGMGSSRSLLLRLDPGGKGGPVVRQRRDYATDAAGEPIVRMPSGR